MDAVNYSTGGHMLAMDYRGPYRVRAEHKPFPTIQHPQDAITRVTRSCICGSDLHLYHGMVPDTRVGMTFGHEFTGVCEEVGSEVRDLAVGDHVLVPFNVPCGQWYFCKQGLFGNCHESNSQASAVGGIFGYSHTAGGYDGGQAEYVRVPYAEVGPCKIPAGMHLDDAVLLSSRKRPTRWELMYALMRSEEMRPGARCTPFSERSSS
jgi:threonine dehydrogenase-like Zn-dependent dehydrogenase